MSEIGIFRQLSLADRCVPHGTYIGCPPLLSLQTPSIVDLSWHSPFPDGSTSLKRGNVRRELIYFGAILILMICVWGHVSELFDRWDNTFQTGNDIEYSTVIVALIAGAAFGLARRTLTALRSVSARFRLLSMDVACSPAQPHPIAFVGNSSPPPLRI